MSDPANTDDSTANQVAIRFDDMGRKVRENIMNGFSGAVMICPPVGNPIEWLIVAGDRDAALFWSTLKTQVEIRIAELRHHEQRNTVGWNR